VEGEGSRTEKSGRRRRTDGVFRPRGRAPTKRDATKASSIFSGLKMDKEKKKTVLGG